MSLRNRLKRFQEINNSIEDFEQRLADLRHEQAKIGPEVFSNVSRQLGSSATEIEFSDNGTIWRVTVNGSLEVVSSIPSVDPEFEVE